MSLKNGGEYFTFKLKSFMYVKHLHLESATNAMIE